MKHKKNELTGTCTPFFFEFYSTQKHTKNSVEINGIYYYIQFFV